MDRRHTGVGPLAVDPGPIRPSGADHRAAHVALLRVSEARVDALTLPPHGSRCGKGAEGPCSSITGAWVREGRIVGTSGDTVLEAEPGLAEREHQRREQASEDHLDRRAAIEAHLTDPGPGPCSVSRDSGISGRCVHAAFSGSGTTDSAVIRSRRIEAVQRSLRGRAALPRMAEPAAHHGSRDTSQRSRAFRDLTGLPGAGVVDRSPLVNRPVPAAL